MSTYAIGDVQGCFDELTGLLDRCRFNPVDDRIWFVGDLVNRGPKSLEVLRFVHGLGERAVVVLGNHDLHLVSVHEGVEGLRKGDTLEAVLDAPDRRELVAWLRSQPLMVREAGYAMVHAGLLPQWTIDKALALAAEVERVLRGAGYREFLANMYGAKPDEWSDELAGWDRLRVIVNVMTRLRFCTSAGRMDFKVKGRNAPAGYAPWFEFREDAETLVVGHWSALGLKRTGRLAALDSGCVWGGQLSALRLEDRTLFQVPCAGYQTPGGEA